MTEPMEIEARLLRPDDFIRYDGETLRCEIVSVSPDHVDVQALRVDAGTSRSIALSPGEIVRLRPEFTAAVTPGPFDPTKVNKQGELRHAK